ncbi:MAG: ABC transporter substrate-binding protein, partial [Myxococcota bacterium]
MWGTRAFKVIKAGLLVLAAGLACRESSDVRDRTPSPLPDRLVIGTRTEPRTLDPAFVRRAADQEIVRLLFRDLTDFDDAWNLQPMLAAALPQARSSTSGWVVDWSLRPGLRWSDGRPLTAADIVFGHGVDADPRWPTVNHQDARSVRKMVAVAPDHLRVFWRGGFADYRAPRVHTILPAHAYPTPTSDGSRFARFNDKPVSSGPYKIENWVSGQQVTLTVNSHWWGPSPQIKTIVFRFLQSEDALEAALLAGTIDAVGEAGGLSPDRALKLQPRLPASRRVVFTDSATRLGIEVRLDHPVLKRASIRHALSAAIDRDRFAQVAYGGAARAAYGLFPPRHIAHDDAVESMLWSEASKVLAGVDGRGLSLQFASDSQAARQAAVFLQNRWAAAGLKVRLDGRPFSVLVDLLGQRKHGPLLLLALRMRPDWDGSSVVRSDGRQNYGGYADAEVDAWIDRAKTATRTVEWRAELRRIERRYRQDLPSIPLLYRKTV